MGCSLERPPHRNLYIKIALVWGLWSNFLLKMCWNVDNDRGILKMFASCTRQSVDKDCRMTPEVVFRSTNSRDWQIWWTGCGLLLSFWQLRGQPCSWSDSREFTTLKRITSIGRYSSQCLATSCVCFASYLMLGAVFCIGRSSVLLWEPLFLCWVL